MTETAKAAANAAAVRDLLTARQPEFAAALDAAAAHADAELDITDARAAAELDLAL
jgi:hypothetical protein